ncbi:MAG: hypothetical protein RJA07_620 [Bacteroidota bacterium]|jgi:PKD repeat protein
MKFKFIALCFIIVCGLVLQYNYSFTHSISAQVTSTGSPLGSGQTCNSCHSSTGGNPASVGYVFYYTGTTTQATDYTPGCTYDVVVTMSGTGNATPKYGFEMDATAGSNGAGTFALTHPLSDPARTQVNTITGKGACEVAHKSAILNGTNQWYFQWVAPSTNIGNITFYLAGIYGNNAGSGSTTMDTLHFSLTPRVVCPTANFTMTSSTICINSTDTFYDATANANNATYFKYFFGTGQGSSSIFGIAPTILTHTYTTPGIYTIVYTVSTDNPFTGNPCTYTTYSKTLTVLNYPDASFTSTINPGCQGGVDTLKITNPAAGVTYTPGYGTATGLTPMSASGPFPLILPNTLGNVNYTMIATGFGCTSPTSTATTQVQACAPPMAAYSTYGYHTAAVPGTYCHNTKYTVHNFSNNSGGYITNKVWKLRGPVVNPIPANVVGQDSFDVIFTVGGIYTITLYITDNRGKTDSTTSNYITINGSCGPILLDALYNSSPTAITLTSNSTATLSTCKNEPITFTDISSGSVISGYRWIWGDLTPDGTTVQETHAYASPGIYTMLYIIDSLNTKFDTLTTTITVGAVSQAYAGRDTALCPNGSSVTLGTASAVGMTYSWTTSHNTFVPQFSNPTITPTVTTTYYLNVSNATGTCQSNDTVKVIIDTIPTFTITASPTTPCPNNQITVSCTPTSLTNYAFSFSGGTPSGTGAGPYLVSWSALGSHCISATAKTALVGCPVTSSSNPCIVVQNCNAPIPAFLTPPQPICEGNTVQFTDATQNNPTSWSWTFHSPDTLNFPAIPSVSGQQNPIVTLPKPGKYYISLNAYNQAGSGIYIYHDSIIVYPTPTSTFQYVSSVCQNYNTYLIYTGNASAAATYSWTFGGGANTGTGQGPIGVKWNTPGSKSITLQVTDNGCPSLTTPGTVTVSPTPIAKFIYNNIGPNYSFINQSSGYTSSFWSFGDNQTSTTQHPIHSYTTNGSYLVTLTVNKGNCADADTATIHAIVNGIDDIMNNNLFTVYHDNANSILKINWVDNSLSKKKIEIINMNGQIIFSDENRMDKEVSIPTASFAKGIYIVKCITEYGNAATKKWLKD